MQYKKIITLFVASITMLALIIFQSQRATAHFETVDTAWQAKVDGWVMETAVSDQQTEFLVFLTEQADLSGAARLQSKEEKGQYVYDRLTAVSARTQAPIIAALKADGIEYQSFWVANMLWVRGDAAVVQQMASRADVAHIYANPTVHLDEPEIMDIDAVNDAIEEAQAIEWNITKVNAPDVWALGYDGTGIVVGGQDTGYRWDHPALINQYRGWNGATANHDYNWHDSIHSGGGSCGANSLEPCDDHGHGTHTMGTMVGDDGGSNQIGMAPGAKWIGCRNMNVGDGTPAMYSECYQWFIAPTQVDGTNPNPAMAPHVINNSWGCPPSEGCTNPNVMLTIVNNVVAAGIITVHSAGNSGSSCSTVSDPSAIYDASYTVGATDSSDTIAGFSSRGPVSVDGSGRMKPDVSAPGVSIRSSTRDGSYQGGWSGTSMAGPHVAGAVALLLNRAPSLIGDSAAVEALLNETAVPRTTNQGCGGDGATDVPNNTYGWGRFDILAAVNAAPPDFNINTTPTSQSICIPDNATFDVTLDALGNITDIVTLQASGHPVGSITSFSTSADVPTYTSTLTISNTAGAMAGDYLIDVVGTTGSLTHTSTVSLTLSPATPIPPTLTTPSDNSVNISTSPTFTWTAVSNATTYAIDIATDAAFTNIVDSALDLTGVSYTTAVSLNSGTQYYWRAEAMNSCGMSGKTAVFSFTTGTNSTIYLPIITVPPISVASVLTPFDANTTDVYGPSYWRTRYGKSPEIIVSSNGTTLDVLAQDYNSGTAWSAVLLRIAPTSTGYLIDEAITTAPMLDRVMGLAHDANGNLYYATGVDENDIVDPYYPPLNTYRNNIVRVVKLNSAGNVQFNIDLDIARHDYNSNAEMIINPMTFGSSRLEVGGEEIALVHSINTDPDWGINGARHQKALSTRLNATNGAITRVSSVWVSHSFDQRLLYDGTGIIESHLGDAYPREIVFNRDHTSYPLLHIKGATGENNTHTRLGNVALIENDPAYPYIALFSTESSVSTGSTISGARNLAIVRVKDSDNSIDPNLSDTLTVTSGGTQYTNRLRWLTSYSAASNLHAERPKLIGIGNDQYVVLWEEWLYTGSYSDTFNGVYGMVIDDEGTTIQAATLITSQHHLHRGDDAFLLDGRAAWMTGNASEQKLYIHFVDASLNYEMVTID